MQEIRSHHPQIEKITAFGLGHLSESDSHDIELHLANCEACRQKLVDVPDDELVRLLQSSAWEGPAPASETQAGLSGLSTEIDAATAARSVESARPSDTKVGPPPFTIPRELDGHARYHVLGPLGAGGMGTVYKARHRLMERVVALKIINPHLVNQPGAVERFTREVKAAAQLVHPNIVTAYDAEKVGDLHLLVMEFVDGQTLAQVLAVEHELPLAAACEYIRQTALGLQHALDRGMVHRDIKPQNLMLVSREVASGSRPSTPRPLVKILDFGLARFVSEQAPSDGTTVNGTLMGSLDYMAPEQGRDAHNADARADIYGMGCTLYHLLAGQIPFPATSLLEKLESHRDKQPRPLCHVRPEVSLELSKVVAKMMAKDPAQRYQTPGEVALALWPFTQVEPAPAPRLSRQRRFAVALGALSLIVLIWATQIVFRVETPHGTLIVKTDDPDVQISVRSGGTEVALFFPKQKKEIPLKVGEYTIELVKGKNGLKLSTNKFEIQSGQDQRTVTVEFEPTVVAGKDPPNVEEQAKVTEPAKTGDTEKTFAWPGDDLWLGRIAAPDLSRAKELYRDDFANLDTSWRIAKTAVDEYGREQGTYFISANPGLVRAAWLEDKTYANFACQVVGRVAKATSTQWYLNYTSAKNQVTVRFHLNGGQALQVSILNDGPTRLVQTIWHTALKQGEEFNKLLVVARGNRFEIFANDVAICDPMVLDVIIPPGHFALGAVANDNPVRAEFKSFTIWSAEGLATPEERLTNGDLKDPLPAQPKPKHVGTPIPANPPLPAIAPLTAAETKNHQEAWAQHLGTQVETVNSVGAKMILIPPGEFLMGSSDEQVEAALKAAEILKADELTNGFIQHAERPQRRVVISKPFLMSATEVTVGQFKKFAAATGHKTHFEAYFKQMPHYGATEDSPVIVIGWIDALAYCNWLSEQEKVTYRLPTEAEWEYACRAGTATQYSFGDDHAELGKYAWYRANLVVVLNPVGGKLPNAFGLFDMHGGVSEFCHERWDEKSYAAPPRHVDPYVVRGGSWSTMPSKCRSAFRIGIQAVGTDDIGFRCVRDW